MIARFFVARVFNPCRAASPGTGWKPVLQLLLLSIACIARGAEKQQPLIAEGADHTLVYRTEPNGDRVPDFSYAGYHAGETPIPDVPVRMFVPFAPGDQTSRVQAAIDQLSHAPLERRGAVLLGPGRWEIRGGLSIRESGIVLRGSGTGESGTTL